VKTDCTLEALGRNPRPASATKLAVLWRPGVITVETRWGNILNSVYVDEGGHEWEKEQKVLVK
jgi:hypothetical protein